MRAEERVGPQGITGGEADSRGQDQAADTSKFSGGNGQGASGNGRGATPGWARKLLSPEDLAAKVNELLGPGFAERNGLVDDPAPEFGSIGAELLEDLRNWLQRFIVVSTPTDLALLALWVAHTFLSRELYTTPRLLIDSITPGSGKTTLLEHLDHLCRKPILAVSMSSAALIPRLLDKEPRTILLDEIQRTLIAGRPDADAVLAVIGSGYRVGAKRPVLVPHGREWEVKELPTFAPVAMAGNSPHLPQDTVDRSIRILLMPDPDGHAEDSDWEVLDGEVTELAERVSQWADSAVRGDRGAAPR